jgi:hypothetical protein
MRGLWERSFLQGGKNGSLAKPLKDKEWFLWSENHS